MEVSICTIWNFNWYKSATPTGAAVLETNLDSITLKVDIPCPGHAPLITSELKTIQGVKSVKFSFPNEFEVSYDVSETSKDEILSLKVFKTYKAEISSESTQGTLSNIKEKPSADPTKEGTCSLSSISNIVGCGGY